ncbi:hypothetical protein BDR22DRAFT_890360 [Usnea florida]
MSSHPLSPPPTAPTLLPSPLPNPSTTDPSSPSSNNNNNQDPPTSHPAPFQPFFTLISTPTTTTTHHPTTHYIFSDDPPDHDPITSAALLVLQHPSHSGSPPAPISNPQDDGTRGVGVGGGDVRERYVLLDMDGTGTKVECAQSMVPDWAVTATEVGAAPTWDREGEGRGEGLEGRGLMLRIEGMEVRGERGDEEGGGGALEGEGKRLEELVEVYERQMAELRRVVDAGQGIVMSGGNGR